MGSGILPSGKVARMACCRDWVRNTWGHHTPKQFINSWTSQSGYHEGKGEENMTTTRRPSPGAARWCVVLRMSSCSLAGGWLFQGIKKNQDMVGEEAREEDLKSIYAITFKVTHGGKSKQGMRTRPNISHQDAILHGRQQCDGNFLGEHTIVVTVEHWGPIRAGTRWVHMKRSSSNRGGNSS